MAFDHLVKRLRTVVAVPVTPFDSAGEVDFEAYRQIVRRMVDGGISAITPNGSLGEFYSLSPEEHRQAVEASVEGSAGEALVLAAVGFDIATAIELGRFARQAGAGCVMAHQPVHPYQSTDGWVAYHQGIADALPSMGIVAYIRSPLITGGMLRQLAEACPNFIGVKYAVAAPPQFWEVVQEVGADRLAWICGSGERWAPFFWVAGARGFTSGLVNVYPSLALEMLQCLDSNNYAGAMNVWLKVKPFEKLRARRNSANSVSVVKEALAQIGLCQRVVRPPITELPESERDEVREILATWNVS